VSDRIGMLQALLARIQANTKKPRQAAAPTSLTVPPSPDAHAALMQEREDVPPPTKKPEEVREVEVPLESRARLVAAPQVEVEVEEIEAEDVMELDDRHVVVQEVQVSVDVNAATQEQRGLEIEEPPPSSRRPIAEPAETPQEAELNVAAPPLTPPPESGKQVATDALSFDDDFTGVRETTNKLELPKPKPEQSIQLQSLRSPAVPAPVVPDELEAEISAPEPPDEPTRPPPGPLPSKVEPEVSRPTRPVAASHVANIPRSVAVPAPKTFGELLDLTLGL
jgi:hypothetical protein